MTPPTSVTSPKLWYRVCLASWVALNIFCAVWTNDLTQVNRETLFLTQAGNTSYNEFKAVVDERRVLAVKLELNDALHLTIDEPLFTESRKVYEGLKEKYSGDDFAWMDFQDIYFRAIGDLSFANISAFAQKFPNLMMPMLGPQHSGFLLMIGQNVDDGTISHLVSDILEAPWPKAFRVFMGGLPYINNKLNQYADDIKFTLIPIMVVLSVLLTWWLTRSLRVAGLLMIPAVCSLLQSLMIAKALFGSLNMVTAVVPLMMFVINLMVCFHLFYAIRASGSFKAAWAIKRIPLILSVLTMAVGFGANLVSEVPVIRHFAIVSSVSVLVSSVLSVIGIWLLQRWLVLRPTDLECRMFNPALFAQPLSFRVIRALSCAIFAASIFVLPRLELLTDATQYFPTSSGLREAIQHVEKDFLGTPSFELLVRRLDDEMLSFEDYKALNELESLVKKSTTLSYKIFSLGTLLTEANRLFSGEDTFPPQRISWTMLKGGLPESVKAAFPAGKVYRISLMGTTMNSDLFRAELAKLKSTLDKFAVLGFKVEFNGLSYQLMCAQEELVSVMAEGFGVTLLLVTILFAVTFRRVSVVLGFLLASLLPMGVGVIAIYVFGFSLNIATVMTFSIALGMIVDNSFHMAWNVSQGRSYDDYYRDTIVPIVGSGIILGIGFAMFSLNGFLPIRQVGVLVASMLVSGIGASLFVLGRNNLNE
jgi:predicted RND superfamily exporter protein